MKKIISLTVAALLFVCFATGCDVVESGKKAVEQGMQNVEKGASTLMKDEKAMLNEGKDMIQGTVADRNGSNPSNEEKSKFIGEEKAKEIALKKAEIGSEGVRFEHVDLERDDGVWQYDVEFRHGKNQYDIDINAETGEILSFDKD